MIFLYVKNIQIKKMVMSNNFYLKKKINTKVLTFHPTAKAEAKAWYSS